jgi:hypothetical protein
MSLYQTCVVFVENAAGVVRVRMEWGFIKDRVVSEESASSDNEVRKA